MTLTIVSLDQEENFLRFLDPELCTLEETITSGGLRTLNLDYKFQDLGVDKQLFKLGNKIWIQGDENLSDCLYVINTSVKEDIYQENSLVMELEEVLVELNYAPVLSQTEITSDNGFNISTTNGKQEVTIDWNALNYFFGKYFNIGVVQDCLSEYAQKISITGTINRMTLLRYIEEETGNVFVTRYEKDIIDNTIHRYLDFLNPINVNKNWEYNLEYEFIPNDNTTYIYDENDNLTTDTYDDVHEPDDIPDPDPLIDVPNINPENIIFRFTDYWGQLIDDDLQWSASDLGLVNNNQIAVISITRTQTTLAIDVGNKSYAVGSEENNDVESPGNGILSISRDPENQVEFVLPDDAWFEFYDSVNDRVLFHTRINHMIGTVHEEILDFGFNLENITYEVDETDTYHAIAPILTSEGDNGLTRTQMNSLINDWLNLEVSKGDLVPMIVQKSNVKSSAGTLAGATASLGTYNLSNNYFVRPYNPNDNTSGTNATDKTFEFFKAIAYWKAPFTKHAGEMHIETENHNIQYLDVLGRPDARNQRGLQYHPKIGNVETSDENIYSIFNDVCMKLKDKQYPEVKIEVDVANLLRTGEYNNYQLHDKVYIKIPDSQELLVARVTKTKKEAHDIAKNTIEISNYTVNTVKTLQHETSILADNLSFPYPTHDTLTIRLQNDDYDDSDEFSVQYPANKLISIALYRDNEYRKTYTKTTDMNGYCYLPVTLAPGNYDFEISFGGDEEYMDTTLTVQCNVWGTLETVETPKRDTKSKTTSTSSSTTKTVKTYYDKYGRSPDKKKILAIGRISAPGDTGSYANFYVTEFKNYCPHCGSSELYWGIFWAGNETSNWGKFPATGRQEGGSAEGHIFCKKCDADYSVQGHEHVSGGKSLKVTKSTKKSSKTDAYNLKKGKYQYGTKTETVKAKSTNTQTRTNISSGMNSTLKKKALSIVGDSTGVAAAKKIAEWVRKNIKYSYYGNFHRSPKTVLSKGGGNCCDQTRLMLTLMDAAGCRATLTLKYTLVCCNTTTHPGVGHCFGVIKNNSTGKTTYVDPCYSRGNCWGHHISGWGSPPGRQYSYTYGSAPF